MTIAELKQTLQKHRNLSAENEIVEFKEAKNGYDFNKLGKNFSTLRNKANLNSKPHAWQVFGEEVKHHYFICSHYRIKSIDNIQISNFISTVL